MTRVWFPGGWYCDSTRTDHAVLFPDKKIGTSKGDLSLPAGGNVLHLRVANIKGRFCIAGQGNQDGLAWLWNGNVWTALGLTYGTSTCAFGPLGCYISRPKAVDNIEVYDVETLQHVLSLTKPVGVRGIASITGLGMNPSDVQGVDEWYNTVPGLAECMALDPHLAVGQGASGGLCVRDGDAFQTIEPGSVQFVRASLDGDVISTAAWKDAEQGAVIIRLDRSELHQETPVPEQPRFWLHPNIASADLLQLIDSPELAKVQVLGLYIQDIIFDGHDQGPNTWQALQVADFYRKLKARGIQLVVEMGSLKDGDCDCQHALHNLEQMLTVVRDHGGEVTYITQDEPLTAWQAYCSKSPTNMTLPQVADVVAAWMKRATELGVPFVGYAEAWPNVGFAVIQQFLDLLQARGVKPPYLEVDVDWNTAKAQGKDVSAFIKAASALCEARGIILSLLVNSTVDPITPDAAHALNLAALARKIHAIEPNPTRIVVQSWARRSANGLQDVPANLGPSGLLASLADTVSVFGGTVPEPPKPDPEPLPIPEGPDMLSKFMDPATKTLAVKSTKKISGSLYTLISPNGRTVSIQPNGDIADRDPDAHGRYEICRINNDSTATYFPDPPPDPITGIKVPGQLYTFAYVIVDELL